MEKIKKALRSIPHCPGVYIYKDDCGNILYVGKAIDLYRRVHQYFNASMKRFPRLFHLVEQISTIEIRKTVNEFDALILESKLIRRYQPKYNAIAKDDKSPLYVLLKLSEELPHVLLIRKTELPPHRKDYWFGPFQSTRTARSLLRTIRQNTPFCMQKRRDGRPCFYHHLGMCDPCPSVISRIKDTRSQKQSVLRYRKNIFRVRDILMGKSSVVVRQMEQSLSRSISSESYEEASLIQKQIHALSMMLAHRYSYGSDIQSEEVSADDRGHMRISGLRSILAQFFPGIKELNRIECVDISHTFGTYAAGSITVFSQGLPNTSEYRRFRIQGLRRQNDVAMMSEVISRRLTHKDWSFPDLFVVDGGKAQVQAVLSMLEQNKLSIPTIGLAKQHEDIIVKDGSSFRTMRIPPDHPALHLLMHLRDEAHRFAVFYHRHIRTSEWIRA